MPIKDLDLRHAKPGEKPYKIGAGHGLHLSVQPNGSKRWRMKYRFHGKENLLSFGPYPEVTLAEARAKCLAARDILRSGRNPALYRSQAAHAAAMSFEGIARMWHAGRAENICPEHAQRVLARFERDVFPLIGGQAITSVRIAEVLDVLRRVEARGALDTARRLKQNISQVFRFAMANDWVDNDPSAHLSGALRPPRRRRHMPRVELSELPTLVAAIRAYDDGSVPRRRETTRHALLFTLLTWARTGELRSAAWSEFEGLDNSSGQPLWRIPAERMKTKCEHIVPLSRQAASILRQRKRMPGRGHLVFSGDDPDRPISENTMIYACYRMGYLGRQTVHGFRGLASTWANESGRYRPDWIEMALGHNCEDKVRAAYNSALYLDMRRTMLQDWADHLDRVEAPQRAPEAANGSNFVNSPNILNGWSIGSQIGGGFGPQVRFLPQEMSINQSVKS